MTIARKYRPKGSAITMEFVQSHCSVDLNTGCWNWGRSVDTSGYAHINLSGKTARVHRIVWELWKGSPPGQMQVLHRCDNRRCCNPDHLFLGTNADNMRDAIRKSRHAHKLTKEQASEILTSTETGTALARKFHVSNTIVFRVRHRKHGYSK